MLEGEACMFKTILHTMCVSVLQNVHHQYRNLGGWTFAFEDYYDLNITAHLDDPLTLKMSEIIDPYGEMSLLVCW